MPNKVAVDQRAKDMIIELGLLIRDCRGTLSQSQLAKRVGLPLSLIHISFRMLRAAGTQIIIISMRLSTVVVKICTFNFQSVLGILQMSFVLFAIESISFIQRKWVKKIGSGVAHLRQKRYPSMQICLGKQFLQFWILAWLRFLLLKQS